MPNQPKSTNADEKEMRCAFTNRLKELINETGGDKKFTEKLDKVKAEESTDVKLVKGWKDPEKDIQLKTLYLIAAACNVSADWLLGLSAEKSRKEKGFKRPVTYGDALSILNNLFKIGVIGIADSSHWSLDIDIYADNGVILPKYIQIKDKHLIDLIKDLYRAKELSKEQITDAWERTIKLEINNPLREHGSNPNHNDTRSEQDNINKTAVPTKVLNNDALKKQVTKQLRKLKNDLSDIKFGEKIGISKSTVSGWFDGHLPKTYNLYKIAKEYDVYADWILGLDETSYTATPWEEEAYTYGNVLSMLKYLTEKGTIGFVEEYSHSFDDFYDDCKDNKNAPVVDDLLVIDDQFLFCLLLQQNILERYSTAAFQEIFEELFNKYKDTPLLSFKENMRSDSCKILHNLWNGDITQNIDFDKLYKDLQGLSDSKSDK